MPEAIRSPRADAPLDHSWLPTRIDTSVAHTARIYDYFLDGKDNFPADRQAAAEILRGNPGMRDTCREQRGFLRRAVRFLTHAGIRQFIDIGTGLPTQENTHQVAQAIAPDARVAYVDNDPIVLAHARVLMADRQAGRTIFLHADAREPERILADPEVRGLIDFEQPIAVLTIGLLHFIPDDEHPETMIGTLKDAIVPGSYLAFSHGTPDHDPGVGMSTQSAYQSASVPCRVRTRDEVMAIVGPGMEMVEPGLVLLADWRPDGTATAEPQKITYAGVARKL